MHFLARLTAKCILNYDLLDNKIFCVDAALTTLNIWFWHVVVIVTNYILSLELISIVILFSECRTLQFSA